MMAMFLEMQILALGYRLEDDKTFIDESNDGNVKQRRLFVTIKKDLLFSQINGQKTKQKT